MNNIGREEFKCISITCDIDRRDCDEHECCSTCQLAIETVAKDIIKEFEDNLLRIDPNKGAKRSQRYKYILNIDNTIAMYNTFEEFEADRFLPIQEYKVINHGFSLRTWLYFPAWYELQHLLHLGIPDYYLFRNNKNPLIAVYPGAVYMTAPRIDPDEAEEYGE